ncbi:MAG: hypothetical protein EBZ48_15585 [Proteobacteria bacterium]|nr:hypothetical protein [Pseudomonadota bacterium]
MLQTFALTDSVAISDQRSAISDQRSAISDQRSAITNRDPSNPLYPQFDFHKLCRILTGTHLISGLFP